MSSTMAFPKINSLLSSPKSCLHRVTLSFSPSSSHLISSVSLAPTLLIQYHKCPGIRQKSLLPLRVQRLEAMGKASILFRQQHGCS